MTFQTSLNLKIHSEFVCTTGTIINGLLRNLMIPFKCLVFFGFTKNYKTVFLSLKWSVFTENLRPALFSDSLQHFRAIFYEMTNTFFLKNEKKLT